MDFGTSTYTEYEPTAQELFTMLELFPQIDPIKHKDSPYKIGHIHSHNKMPTFFSGTDTSELKDNAHKFSPFYLSLIVNYNGRFAAKVAYVPEEIETTTITIVRNKPRIGFPIGGSKTKKIEKAISHSVQSIDCKISIDVEPWLGTQIKELQEKRASKTTVYHGQHSRVGNSYIPKSIPLTAAEDRVYQEVMKHLPDLFSLGIADGYLTAFKALEAVDSALQPVDIPKYKVAFINYFQEWHFYNFQNVDEAIVVKCLQKFIGFHSDLWLCGKTGGLTEAINLLKEEYDKLKV